MIASVLIISQLQGLCRSRTEPTDLGQSIVGVTEEEIARSSSMTPGASLAVRALRQDHIGRQLHAPLVSDEDAWLDADLG